MQYAAYKTNHQAPKCVKYWDATFRKTELFFDWQATFSAVEYHIPFIQTELGLRKKEARALVWNAYCDAVTGDVTSPFFEEFDQFCQAVTEDTVALFALTCSVGVDIHGGYSQQEAEQEFKRWLLEDPTNGRFGKYRINQDLSIEKVR